MKEKSCAAKGVVFNNFEDNNIHCKRRGPLSDADMP